MRNDRVVHEADVLAVVAELLASVRAESAPVLKPVRRMMKRLQRMHAKARHVSRQNDRRFAHARKSAGFAGFAAMMGLVVLSPSAHALSVDAPAVCQHVLEEYPTENLRIEAPGIVIHCTPDNGWEPILLTLPTVADLYDWQYNHGHRTIIEGEGPED